MKTSFDFVKFAEQHNISTEDSSSKTKHTREGWINTRCPICGTDKLFLGWNIERGHFHCWSGGKHNLYKLIEAWTGKKPTKALIQKYQKTSSPVQIHPKQNINYFIPEPPEGTQDKLGALQRRYLETRNFDPDEIKKIWDIKSTPSVGRFSHRLVMPVYYKGKIWHYQTRDVTGLQNPPYLQIPNEKTPDSLKNLVYGLDYVHNAMIIVEGVFDAWRIGKGAVCLFGCSWTMAQLEKLLEKNCDMYYVLFDNDNLGVNNDRDRLIHSLKGFDKNVAQLSIDASDPAEMDDEETKEVRNLVRPY